MTKLLSFHGQQSIKDEYISRIKLHAAADEIIKGTYWQNGKGCAVGCTVHSNNHLSYGTELGIPLDLAIYEDKIFESLPNDEAKKFPLEFLESIPVGVNLEKVGLNFSLWLVTDEKDGLLSKITNAPSVEFLNKLAEILKKEIADTATEDDRKEFNAYAYAYAFASRQKLIQLLKEVK